MNKLLAIILVSASFKVEAKLRVEDQAAEIDVVLDQGAIKDLNSNVAVSRNSFRNFLDGLTNYKYLEKSKVVNNFLSCCQTGDHRDIDMLMRQIEKKIEKDDLFLCGLTELSLLFELLNRGLVHERCLKSFTKQVNKLLDVAKGRVNESTETSFLSQFKQYLQNDSSPRMVLGSKYKDFELFLKHVKNELRCPGCSEKQDRLEFEPGTYIDGLVDLNILLGNSILQVDGEARSSVVKLIKVAYDNGFRYFESSPHFPILSADNRKFLIQYYRDVVMSLIKDYLVHPWFLADEQAQSSLARLLEKINTTNISQKDSSKKQEPFAILPSNENIRPGATANKVGSKFFSRTPNSGHKAAGAPGSRTKKLFASNPSLQIVGPKVIFNVIPKTRTKLRSKKTDTHTPGVKFVVAIEPAEIAAQNAMQQEIKNNTNNDFLALKANALESHKRLRSPRAKKQ